MYKRIENVYRIRWIRCMQEFISALDLYHLVVSYLGKYIQDYIVFF